MDLKKLRIGYSPCSQSFDAPSDRRRFVYYARKRGLKFEVACTTASYDVVVLNQRADISQWSKLPRGRTKVIYDCVDSYLATSQWDLLTMFRGLYKYASGQNRKLSLSFQKLIQQMCSRADAVVCSTEEQKEMLLSLCDNVHIILDFHASDVLKTKKEYSRRATFNFVWEGLGSRAIPMKMLREILEPISLREKIVLHLVTDVNYYYYGDMYFKRSTVNDIRRKFGPLAERVYLYQWNPLVLSEMAVACDLALIPLELGNAFQRGKPENKLILFWRMGVPTITSASPAYRRVMEKCGLPMTCGPVSEWQSIVTRYMSDETAREAAGSKGREFAEKNYSEENTLQQWDDLLISLFQER